MEKMTKITILKTPKIWFLDKYNAGTNRMGLYLVAIIPSVIIMIGLLADLNILYELSTSQIFMLTLWLMFFYGVLNVIMMWALQKNEVRLARSRRTYIILNEKIITVIKDYRAQKRDLAKRGKQLSEDFIVSIIEKILAGVNDTYLKDMHRKNVAVTLKYCKGGKLIPIRVGGNSEERKSISAESDDKGYVFKCINHFGKSLRFIYVKNLDNLDKYELEAIGVYKKQIKERAGDYYKSFISLPLRGGRIKVSASNGMTSVPNLGIVGFDLKEKYGFGNFSEHEYHYLASFASLLSEPVQDLIEI